MWYKRKIVQAVKKRIFYLYERNSNTDKKNFYNKKSTIKNAGKSEYCAVGKVRIFVSSLLLKQDHFPTYMNLQINIWIFIVCPFSSENCIFLSFLHSLGFRIEFSDSEFVVVVFFLVFDIIIRLHTLPISSHSRCLDIYALYICHSA